MSNVFAFDTKTASMIFEKIFSAIFTQDVIPIYANTKEYKEVIELSEILRYEVDAKLVIVTHKGEIPSETNKILFTTDPEILQKYSNVIGAFYWEKGRPKIIFVRDRLDFFHLSIDPSFEKYMVDSL